MANRHRLGNWVPNKPKGYPRLTSGPHRGKYLHRAVFEDVAGRPIKEGYVIHHMNGKACACPHELLECPPEFNTANVLRDPYTGAFMSAAEWERRYGNY